MTLPNDRGLPCLTHSREGDKQQEKGGGGEETKSSLNCRSATEMIASQFQNMFLLTHHGFTFLLHIWIIPE